MVGYCRSRGRQEFCVKSSLLLLVTLAYDNLGGSVAALLVAVDKAGLDNIAFSKGRCAAAS